MKMTSSAYDTIKVIINYGPHPTKPHEFICHVSSITARQMPNILSREDGAE